MVWGVWKFIFKNFGKNYFLNLIYYYIQIKMLPNWFVLLINIYIYNNKMVYKVFSEFSNFLDALRFGADFHHYEEI